MTTKLLSLVTLILITSLTVSAKKKTEKFKVSGSCGMCEARIEKAANSVEGVNSAEWDKETKNLEVIFDDKKANVKQIQTSITIEGHDTEMFSASDNKYKSLPGCCQYERGEKKSHNHHGNHEGCGQEKKSECSTHDKKSSSGSCCGGH